MRIRTAQLPDWVRPGTLALALAASAAAQPPAEPLAVAGHGAAAEFGVEVLGGPHEVEPGAVVTLALRVRHASGAAGGPQILCDVPPGWSVVAAPSTGVLQPGTSQHVLLGLRVPADALHGRSEVKVRAGRSGASWALTVARRPGLAVRAGPPPAVAVSGERLALEWWVQNTGNDSLSVQLSPGRGSLPVSLPDSLHLAPGEAQHVKADLELPAALAEAEVWPVVVEATGRTFGSGETVSSRARTEVRVVPSPAHSRVRAPRTYLATRSVAVSAPAGGGIQTGLAVSVPLRHDSSVVVAGAVRTPQPDNGVTGEPGEATLRVEGPGVRAQLGTGVYRLSPVTAGYVYGLGAQAEATRGAWNAAVVLRRSRLAVVDLGGALGRTVGPVRLDAHALRQLGGPGRAAALRAQTDAAGRLDVEAGLAGRTTLEPTYQLQWALARGPGSFALGTERRGPDHPGADRGSQHRSATGALRLPGRQTLQVGAWEQGFSGPLGPERSRSGVDAGMRHQTGDGRLTTRVGLGIRSKKNIEPNAVLGASGMFGTVGAALRHGAVSVAASVEAGHYADAEDAGAALAGTVSGTWAGRRVRLLATVEGQIGRSLDAHHPRAAWGVRAQGLYRAGRTQLRGTVAWDRYSGASAVPYAAVGESVDGRAAVTVPLGAAASLTADVSAFRVGKTAPLPRLQLGLNVALSGRAPFPLQPDIVSGRIVHAETGAGVAGVLIQLGSDLAVSDSEGRFSFLRPDAGTYDLQLDRLSLGTEFAPAVPLPLRVEVRDGRLPDIEIPVWTRSRLAGEVRTWHVRGGVGAVAADTVAGRPLAGAVVVASQGDVRHRATTDVDGRFALTDLTPGWWDVAVVAGGPAGADLGRQRVLVPPGGEGSAALRVVASPRKVRLQAAPVEPLRVLSRRAPDSGLAADDVDPVPVPPP